MSLTEPEVLPTGTLDEERDRDIEQLKAMLEINGVIGVLAMLNEALKQSPGVDII